jgi:hypothetical protein
VNPDPSFNSSNVLTGHLQVIPKLINKGGTVKLYWNVSNVLSCSVSGNNETWSGTIGAGLPTNVINAQTPFTLTCQKLPSGATSFSETQTVNIIPGFQEK